MKKIFSTRPIFLIKNGYIDQKALSKNRISIDELISKLRQQGITDINEVKYAIIEQDGQLSIIPKSPYRQPTLADMDIEANEVGIMHVVIANGSINRHGLKVIDKDEEWVKRQLSKQKIQISDVFLMTVNDADQIQITKKE